MAKPYRNTLADYVVIGFSPVLLIGLLTCLVWFLLELVYSGQAYYETRRMGQLQWVLFWFVLAVVLITRISLTGNTAGAIMYGTILAIVVVIVTLKFVNIPTEGPLGRLAVLVPPALLALTWVCAHWITKDCTHISEDEEDETANVGVMDLLQERTKQIDTPLDDQARKNNQWMTDYQKERAKERRKHAPGTLVVYFSLAALPLFGLGQAIIPSANSDGRRYIFWLLVGYVGCGLGLLMTTSFLGLRRYMHLRKLRMPRSMTGTWLTTGALTVVVLLVVGAFLPRPDGFLDFKPMAWMETLWPSSGDDQDDDASENAVVDGQAGKGEGAGQGEGQGKDQHGNQGGQLDPNAAGQAAGGQGEGAQKGGQQGGKEGDQEGQGGQSGGQQRSEGDQKGQPQRDGQRGQGRDQRNPNDRNNQQQNGQDGRPGGGADQRQQRAGARSGSRSTDGKRTQRRERTGSQSSNTPPSMAMTVMSWIILILIVAGAIFAIYWFRASIAAWLRQSWKNWWNWWRSWFRKPALAGATAEKKDENPPKPFASFQNPFENPTAFPNKEAIVQYSFDALQSWAYEHRLPRRLDETPIEFADRFGDTFRDLENGSQRLANLYSLVTYARQQPPQAAMETLKEFWHLMEKSAPTYLGVA